MFLLWQARVTVMVTCIVASRLVNTPDSGISPDLGLEATGSVCVSGLGGAACIEGTMRGVEGGKREVG